MGKGNNDLGCYGFLVGVPRFGQDSEKERGKFDDGLFTPVCPTFFFPRRMDNPFDSRGEFLFYFILFIFIVKRDPDYLVCMQLYSPLDRDIIHHFVVTNTLSLSIDINPK